MKCLILCMCCNNQYYLQQFENNKQTWAKPILDGEYPDIDIWAYTASNSNDYNIDVDKRMIYVPALDGLNGTFDKTAKAIQSLAFFNITYDCIIRTNCSSIINLKMLQTFINSDMFDKTKIYTAEKFLCGNKAAPYELCPIARGNFILMDKQYASLITDTGLQLLKQLYDYKRPSDIDMFTVDDVTIMGIFNAYFILNDLDPFDMYVTIPYQYLDDIYVNKTEIVSLNTFVFFNKSIRGYDQVPIEMYYDKKLAIFDDFCSNYINLLLDDLEALEYEILRNTMYIFNVIYEGNPIITHVYPDIIKDAKSIYEIRDMLIKQFDSKEEYSEESLTSTNRILE